MNHDVQNERLSNDSGQGRWRIALVAFIAIAAYFLLTEHRAHLSGYLPLLWLLACALMHVFMHGGHGHGHGAGTSRPSSSADPAQHRDSGERQ